MALRQTCACTRYLSPTRSPKHHRYFLPSPLTASAQVLPNTPSPSRWRSSVQQSNTRWRSSSLTRARHSISSNTEQSTEVSITQSSENDPSTNRRLSKSLESIKDWATMKRPTIDISALARMVASLHVDLPKYLPDYKKFVPKAITEKSTKEGNRTDASTTQAVAHENVSRTGASPELLKKDLDGVVNNKSFQQGKVELHEGEHIDFGHAMSDTHDSVKTYYSDIKLNMSDISSRDGIPTSKSKVKDANKNNNSSVQSRIVQQLSRVVPIMREKSPPKDLNNKPDLKQPLWHQEKIARSQIDRRTRALVISLKRATSNMSRLMRLEDFCKHMLQHPDARGLASKMKVLPVLLRLREGKDVAVREQAMEALALVGYVDPIKARGIRILSIDGGGTRGLVALEILKHLEMKTGKPIHELFDYVCGVSTGALIAAMVCLLRLPLTACEALYKDFSKEVFSQSRLMGTSKLVFNHAFYDSQLWENILRENIGLKSFLETSRDPACPRVSAVSTIVNQATMENYLFRNYRTPPNTHSHYPGSIQHTLWEAIRASSAAPGYYEEKKIGHYIHQDGGLLTNNPTAIALHEARLLWPAESVQCVISVGTGRHRPANLPDPNYKLKDKLLKVVQSATDTEAVHTIMNDLLPPSSYFRFNTYLTEDFLLDEIRDEKWEQMKLDTDMYCRKNEFKLDHAAKLVTRPRRPDQKALDWAKLQMDLRSAMS